MKQHHGFTLLELIAVLVLVGIMASIAGFGVVAGVRGYLMASESAQISQKAQLAMTRLSREIKECPMSSCGGGNGTIALPFDYENNLGEDRRLELDGNELKIGSTTTTHILTDQVAAFTMERIGDNGPIEIELSLNHLQGGGQQNFEISIFPRNPDIYD
jgi:prepilin-type N-terminal cleavage/methylation domain-containing protein